MYLLLFLTPIAALGLTKPLQSKTEVLKTASLRAYYVEPISHRYNDQQGWISIRAAQGEGHELATIPISELKGIGKAATKKALYDTLNLTISLGKEDITIAKLKIREGWYAPSELCNGNLPGEECSYEFLRDAESQTITLRILSGKR